MGTWRHFWCCDRQKVWNLSGLKGQHLAGLLAGELTACQCVSGQFQQPGTEALAANLVLSRGA